MGGVRLLADKTGLGDSTLDFPRNTQLPPPEVVPEFTTERDPIAEYPIHFGSSGYGPHVISAHETKRGIEGGTGPLLCHFTPKGEMALTELLGSKTYQAIALHANKLPPEILAQLNATGQFIGRIPDTASGPYQLGVGGVVLLTNTADNYHVSDFLVADAGERLLGRANPYVLLYRLSPTQQPVGNFINAGNGFNHIGYQYIDSCGGVRQGLLQPQNIQVGASDSLTGEVNLIPVMDDPDYLATQFQVALSRALSGGQIDQTWKFLSDFVQKQPDLIFDLRKDLEKGYFKALKDLEKTAEKKYEAKLSQLKEKLAKATKDSAEISAQITNADEKRFDLGKAIEAIDAIISAIDNKKEAYQVESKYFNALEELDLKGTPEDLRSFTAQLRADLVRLRTTVKKDYDQAVRTYESLKDQNPEAMLSAYKAEVDSFTNEKPQKLAELRLVERENIERDYLRPALEKVRLSVVKNLPGLAQLLNPYATFNIHNEEKLAKREMVNAGLFLIYAYAMVLGAHSSEALVNSFGNDLPESVRLPYRFVSYQVIKAGDQPKIALSHQDLLAKLRDIYRGITFKEVPGAFTVEFALDWAATLTAIGLNAAAIGVSEGSVREHDGDTATVLTSIASGGIVLSALTQGLEVLLSTDTADTDKADRVFDDAKLGWPETMDVLAILAGAISLGFGLGYEKPEVRVIRETHVGPDGIREHESQEHE